MTGVESKNLSGWREDGILRTRTRPYKKGGERGPTLLRGKGLDVNLQEGNVDEDTGRVTYRDVVRTS